MCDSTTFPEFQPCENYPSFFDVCGSFQKGDYIVILFLGECLFPIAYFLREFDCGCLKILCANLVVGNDRNPLEIIDFYLQRHSCSGEEMQIIPLEGFYNVYILE